MGRGGDWWDIARRDCIGNFFRRRKELIGRKSGLETVFMIGLGKDDSLS